MLRDYTNQEKKYIYNSLSKEQRDLWCSKMHYDSQEFNNERFDGVDDDTVDYEMLNDARRDYGEMLDCETFTEEEGKICLALFYLYINAFYKKYPLTEEEDYWCPACGKKRYHEFKYEVFCPECGWEHDRVQLDDHDYAGGANALSVNELKKQYQEKMAKEGNE